ncbi:MAG: endonuclease V [Acidimicrobiia bacterium]
MKWPASCAELDRLQEALGLTAPEPWYPSPDGLATGGVFVCFGQGGSGPGAQGDSGWAGASVVRDGRIIDGVAVRGKAGAGYRSGYLALREGRLLEAAVRALSKPFDVLLVNATGRDHPRRAGLALHLGAELGIPTIGVTHRALLATGEWPQSGSREATGLLTLGDELVGYWVRTRSGSRPLAVHAAWRTSPETAREVVLRATAANRTPEPLREARRFARTARSTDSLPPG